MTTIEKRSPKHDMISAETCVHKFNASASLGNGRCCKLMLKSTVDFFDLGDDNDEPSKNNVQLA
jgi:hypothetical protein